MFLEIIKNYLSCNIRTSKSHHMEGLQTVSMHILTVPIIVDIHALSIHNYVHSVPSNVTWVNEIIHSYLQLYKDGHHKIFVIIVHKYGHGNGFVKISALLDFDCTCTILILFDATNMMICNCIVLAT